MNTSQQYTRNSFDLGAADQQNQQPAQVVPHAKMQTAIGLGVAGLIPFLLAAAASLNSQPLFGYSAEAVFLGYSVVILSFLCGTLWGLSMASPDSPPSGAVLLTSNLLALVAWAATFFGQVAINSALLVLAVSYVLVLAVEWSILGVVQQRIHSSYRPLRAGLTACVVALHLSVVLIS
jgi:hypothetical protein